MSGDYEKNKDYHRLLSAAAGFKDRFALILVRISHVDVQQEWLDQLIDDLKRKNISVIHICGDSWKNESGNSITSFIKKHIPESGRWILSFSHFDYYMMPKFPDNLRNKSLLSKAYQAIPSPPSFVQRLNVERDAIVKAFPVPVIFWVSPAAVRQVAEHAPDFYDFRQFIIDLPQPTELKDRPVIPGISFIKTGKPEVKADPKEAVALYRKLAKENAYIYLPELVNALNHEAIRLAETENAPAAEKVFAEALKISRELYKNEPEVRSPMLAEVLNNYALFLTGLGKLTEAEVYYRESIELFRGLTNKKYRVLLALVLNNFGVLTASLTRLDEALPLHQEALYLCRLLFDSNPARCRADLSRSLTNLALLLGVMGNHEEADKFYEEARLLK